MAEKVDALERTVMELDAMASIFCNDFIDANQNSSNEEFVVTTPDALDLLENLSSALLVTHLIYQE